MASPGTPEGVGGVAPPEGRGRREPRRQTGAPDDKPPGDESPSAISQIRRPTGNPWGRKHHLGLGTGSGAGEKSCFQFAKLQRLAEPSEASGGVAGLHGLHLLCELVFTALTTDLTDNQRPLRPGKLPQGHFASDVGPESLSVVL